MRVAVYHNLPSGGAKRALFDLVSATSGRVHYDLYRFDLPENEDFMDLRPLVDNVHDYPFRPPAVAGESKAALLVNPLTRLWWLDRVQRQIARDIDAGGYDAVFAHHCRFLQTPLVLKHLRTRSLYYMQEPRRKSFEYDLLERPPKLTANPLRLPGRWHATAVENVSRRLDTEATRAATRVICNSYYSRESILRAYGIDARVCYLGVDTAKFHPNGDDSADPPYVMSVGALQPVKGHDFVIRAVAAVREELRPAVRIVSDRSWPGQQEALHEQARRSGVQLDTLVGISDDDLVRSYGNAAAVVCAARLEPFGYSPVEALCCGTPAVAVREGGYRESVVDGATGYLCDRSERDCARKLEQILERQPFDCGELSRAAHRTWSLEAAGDRLMTQLAELATESR